MSAYSFYYDSFRENNAREYPVWPIGESIEAGATGKLIKVTGLGPFGARYQFQREGHLQFDNDLDPALLQTDRFDADVSSVHVMGGQFVLDSDISGTPDANAEVSGKIKFTSGGQMFVSLEGSARVRIKQVDELAKVLATRPRNVRPEVVVTEVPLDL